MKLLAVFLLLVAPLIAVPAMDQHFDDYGPISWKDERFRLDNFAIQVLNDEKSVGYIFVCRKVDGCPGEAQARAIRAKRYVVEHGGVPWNRVIWRVEGYCADVSTIVQPFPRDVTVPYPFHGFESGKDGPLTKACKSRLQRIAQTRW